MQPVVRDLFPELLQYVSAHQPVQRHPVLATMTTDVIQRGVDAEVQQADDQRLDTSYPQPVQQSGTEGAGSPGPTETTPVLSIHAVSDIESDGGEVCRASSSVTVHAMAEGKVTAEASVKPSSASSKLPESVRCTTIPSSSHRGRKRDSPRQHRPESPRRKQSRDKTDDFPRRHPTTYTIGAEEYRQFQDYIRHSRSFRYRK